MLRGVAQPEDAIFRALADPTRRAIFERLAQGEMAVKDVAASLVVSQPSASQHLAALRQAGLVAERREGRFAYYRIEPTGLEPLVDWLAHCQGFWRDRLERLPAALEEMDE